MRLRENHDENDPQQQDWMERFNNRRCVCGHTRGEHSIGTTTCGHFPKCPCEAYRLKRDG